MIRNYVKLVAVHAISDVPSVLETLKQNFVFMAKKEITNPKDPSFTAAPWNE
jgi:hypothetical protein